MTHVSRYRLLQVMQKTTCHLLNYDAALYPELAIHYLRGDRKQQSRPISLSCMVQQIRV